MYTLEGDESAFKVPTVLIDDPEQQGIVRALRSDGNLKLPDIPFVVVYKESPEVPYINRRSYVYLARPHNGQAGGCFTRLAGRDQVLRAGAEAVSPNGTVWMGDRWVKNPDKKSTVLPELFAHYPAGPEMRHNPGTDYLNLMAIKIGVLTVNALPMDPDEAREAFFGKKFTRLHTVTMRKVLAGVFRDFEPGELSA